MAITQEIVYLRDFAEEAAKLRGSWGRTKKFSTGARALDSYLGGGYGRDDGYEIVVVFGPTKIGKSIICLNFLREPVMSGKRVGLMVLEDDGPDVFLRFNDIMGNEAMNQYVMRGDTVHYMPPDAMMKSWKLEDLLKLIETWFVERELDLILLDHLQFAFENAEALKGETEYIMQRVFMQKLNHLMKRLKKTIIIVSHINKDDKAKGTNKIVGSSSIAQAATKLIEVNRASERDQMEVRLWGSRHTRTPDGPMLVKLDRTRLEDVAGAITI